MINKLPKPPSTQRRFATGWGELDYLCKKIRYWLYARKQKTRARRYTDRLARILDELPDDGMAIIREEGLALLCELSGDVSSAIAHRDREIRLMERLHKEAQSGRYAETTRSYMLQGRQTIDLQERRAILETLKKDEMENYKPGQRKKFHRHAAPLSASTS